MPDVIWDLKQREKKFGKRRVRTQVDRVIKTAVCAIPEVSKHQVVTPYRAVEELLPGRKNVLEFFL